MCFIVLCHFLQYYDNELAWWFNVGVQVFFVISGFLYGTKELKDPIAFIAKNTRKLLVPYFCFLLPTIVLYAVFARDSLTFYSLAASFLCSGTIKGLEHLWFVAYILFCYVLTPYLYALRKKLEGKIFGFVFGVVFAVFFLGQILFLAYGSYFTFSRIFCYILGYFLSFVLQEYGRRHFCRISYATYVLCLIFNVVKIVMKYVLKQSFLGFSYWEQYAHVLLALSLFFAVYISVGKLRENRVLKLSDQYSYYVYLVHQLLILSPFSLLALPFHKTVNVLLTLCGIVVLAVLLKYLSDLVNHHLDSIKHIVCKEKTIDR